MNLVVRALPGDHDTCLNAPRIRGAPPPDYAAERGVDVAVSVERGASRQHGRRVLAVAVTSPKAFLPRLADALAGEGPALLPRAAEAGGPDAGPNTDDPQGADRPWGLELGPDDDDPADPTALVVATSGSTGTPRHVLLNASALLASASATHDRLGGPGRWLLALPAHHVAGLQVLVRSLITRTAPGVLDVSAGFTPERFAEAAREHIASATAGSASRSRTYTSLVPTQLSRLVQSGGEPLELLAAFDAVLIGGAALAPTLLQRARTAGVRVVTTYGMTETCGGCVYDGRPLDGVSVRIEQPDQDGVGRVLLRGPVLARGYLGERGGFETGDDGERLLRTSDLGRLENGRLTVLGRADDVIVTGGMKIAPSVVEDVLSELPSVAEVVVVGVPDEEWGHRVVAAVVPARGAAAPTLAALRAHAAERLGKAHAPRQLLVLASVPLRGPGKPDRAELVAQATTEADERPEHRTRRPNDQEGRR